jgi:tetratricopeptide (TPR) repeat protein
MLALLALLQPLPVLGHPGASSAIDHFSHELEQKPKDQALFVRRGIAYSNDGQYDLALADFEQAKKLGEPILVSFDLGVLHYRRAELELARAYFDEYLEVFPDHAPCLEYRARLLRDMGDQAGSVADFQRVFELLERPNPGHYISVSRMLEASGGDGLEQALELLDTGNAKLGITPQLQKHAMQLELQRERPDLAIKRLQTLEPMLGKSPDWKVDMAELRLLTGEKELARQLLQEASGQLDSLRRTPARIALKERIALLQQRA